MTVNILISTVNKFAHRRDTLCRKLRLKKSKPAKIECDDTLIGYCRISTEEQNLQLQVDAMIRAGICEHNIFRECLSGVADKRPERDAAVKQCRPGSTFVVWRLDRAGRSLLDLLNLMEQLQKMGVGFRSLQDNIDTTTPVGKVMLAMLGAFAQFERDLITDRTRAGVARAMAEGMKFGPPIKVTEKVKEKIEAAIASGRTVEDAASVGGIAVSTLRMYYKAEDLKRIRARGKR